MPTKLIRTIGATVVLAVLGVGAAIQVWGDTENEEVDIVVGSTETTASTAPTRTESSLFTTQPAPEEFVYRIGMLGAPSTDNFWEFFGTSPTVWDAYVLAPTKGSLFSLDRTQTPVPDLALEVPEPTWNADGWHVTVPLRRDSRWSDGTPVTAHDFAFTFNTVRSLALEGQWTGVFPAGVTSVRALDDFHVEVEFASQPGLELWPYGVGTAPVMSAGHWSGLIPDTAQDLFALSGRGDPSSGPVILDEIDEDRIAASANPGYRGASAPDRIDYLVYPDVNALADGLLAGEVDTMVSPRGLTQMAAAKLSDAPGVTVTSSPLHAVRYLAFNLDRAPMDERAFRFAVAALVDREELAATVANSPASTSLIPQTSGEWYDASRAEEIAAGAPDFETALALLGEAGYTWTTPPSIEKDEPKAGEGLRIGGVRPAPLTILTAGDAYDPDRARYAEKVAVAVELLGFEVIPVTTDFATVIDLTFTRTDAGDLGYDMAILGWTLGNPGLPSFYSDLLGAASPANNTGYGSEEMEALLAKYRNAPDLETARDLLWEIEALAAEDMPYLPLYAGVIVEAYRSDLVTLDTAPGVGGIQGELGAIQGVSPAP